MIQAKLQAKAQAPQKLAPLLPNTPPLVGGGGYGGSRHAAQGP